MYCFCRRLISMFPHNIDIILRPLISVTSYNLKYLLTRFKTNVWKHRDWRQAATKAVFTAPNWTELTCTKLTPYWPRALTSRIWLAAGLQCPHCRSERMLSNGAEPNWNTVRKLQFSNCSQSTAWRWCAWPITRRVSGSYDTIRDAILTCARKPT